MLVLADADNPQTCAFRGVTEYISAACAIGWDVTAGNLFPVVECNGEGRSVAITATPQDGRLVGTSTRRGVGRPFHDSPVQSRRIA